MGSAGWHTARFEDEGDGEEDTMKTPYEKGLSSLRGQAPVRVGDVAATEGSRKRHINDRGFTLVELLVTMSLMAIVLGIALPQFRARPYALWTAHEQLLADLRLARADALTKGDHFRFDITSGTTYREYRMQFVGGVWVVNGPPVRDRTLPAGVAFTTAIGNQFEFNTRGLMLNPGAATTITLTEASTNHTRLVTLWPSGQVMPL